MLRDLPWQYRVKHPILPLPVSFALEYYQMVIIPSGARSIRIYEMNVSTSYISVRNALKKYYLNGHWTVDWPGRYKFSGTAFDYRRSYREPESLTSPGPTNETLIVEVGSSLLVSGLGFEVLGCFCRFKATGKILHPHKIVFN